MNLGDFQVTASNVAEFKEKTYKYHFELIKDFTRRVIDNNFKSLLLTGSPGIGKSYNVFQTLEENNIQYELCKSKMTAYGLYEYLHIHNKDLIVFDDLDSIWTDRIAVNVLKAALDSTGDRKISYHTAKTVDPDAWYEGCGKLPNTFNFEGKIIFISNRSLTEFDQAVGDRCKVYSCHMSAKEIIELVKDKKYEMEIAGDPSKEIRDLIVDIFESSLPLIRPSLRLFRECCIDYITTPNEGLALYKIQTAIKYSTHFKSYV